MPTRGHPITLDVSPGIDRKRLIDKQSYPLVSGKAAPLNLNNDWLKTKRWTQENMSKRTAKLIKAALDYWKRGSHRSGTVIALILVRSDNVCSRPWFRDRLASSSARAPLRRLD